MGELPINQIIQGDCIDAMREWPAESINLVMTSPPYWGLRSYQATEQVWEGDPKCEHNFETRERKTSNGGMPGATAQVGATKSGVQREIIEEGVCSKCGAWRGQLGLEPDYRMYVQHIVEIGQEIKRVLRKTGSWYLNLGDTYAGSGCGKNDYRNNNKRPSQPFLYCDKPNPQHETNLSDKCQVMIPHRVALALVEDGWICRNTIIWYKPNSMPSSVKDRLTNKYEFIFHLVKSKHYFYDLDAVRVPHQTQLHPSGRKDTNQYGEDTGNRKRMLGINSDRAWGTPLGKNPGDVVYEGKFTKEAENFNSPRARTARAGYDAEKHFYNPAGKNPGDTIEDIGDFWSITTRGFPEAHFATYPEALCERPIKSSCPVQMCKKCGKSRERIIKIKGYVEHPQREGRRVRAVQFSNDENRYKPGGTLGLIAEHEIAGWTDCGCGASFEPGIVLDPMCGSGTTCVVAKRLGRRYIGIDLNPSYVAMSRKRLDRIEWPIDNYLKPSHNIEDSGEQRV